MTLPRDSNQVTHSWEEHHGSGAVPGSVRRIQRHQGQTKPLLLIDTVVILCPFVFDQYLWRGVPKLGQRLISHPTCAHQP